MTDRPVVYLDVDGVLWDLDYTLPPFVSQHDRAVPARGLEEFMSWALAHCEVRWCTTWAMSGTMRMPALERLAQYTRIPATVWQRVRPSLGWVNHKGETIPWDEHLAGRPFAWIEDGLGPEDIQILAQHDLLDSYIHTDVFEDPDALRRAHATLVSRWGPDQAIRP